MELLRKYGVQTDIYFPLIVADSQDYAGSGNYTYTAGDAKISKDGGAAANPTNSPSTITMGNGAIWKLTLTATEMEAALIVVTFVDSATKAISDQTILIATYGNSSAQHAFDFDSAALTAGAIADAVLDEALTEPSSVFAWGSASLRNVIAWLGALARNKITQDNSETALRNDADNADIALSTISDDGETFIRGEWT